MFKLDDFRICTNEKWFKITISIQFLMAGNEAPGIPLVKSCVKIFGSVFAGDFLIRELRSQQIRSGSSILEQVNLSIYHVP